MNSATVPPVEGGPLDAAARPKDNTTSRQIRGSSLLLVGRMLSMVVNFAIQVMIVRYLKDDYGAFAYALSFVVLGQAITSFGLDRAVTRFVPIYYEQRDYNKMFGTLLLVMSTFISIGLCIIVFVYTFQGWIANTLLSNQEAHREQTIGLLLILIALAPVQALDDLIAAMFAIFASPRSIFFRKYLLAPGLKLAVVLLLIFGQSGTLFLASGYLVAGVLGVTIYAVVLFRVLSKQRLFQHFNLRSLNIPARELFTFTIPLLSSDLVNVLMSTSDAVLLGYFRSTAEVGAFRVVQPAALLNQFVLSSFTFLFTPMAARLFARNDTEGINNLYWQTAIWTAVLSFPIFALTFSLAQPLTVLVYGQRWESSAAILTVLSIGYYFNAVLGFNGLTLKVYGKLRYIVMINILAAVLNVAINLLLIPYYGAMGAAFGTCATMIIHNILKQVGLRYGTGIKLFERRYLKVYVSIVLGALGLLIMQSLMPRDYSLTSLSVYISFAFAGVVSLLVLGLNRKLLNIEQTFPELLRLPLARRLFGK